MGVETVRHWVKDYQQVNIIGATAADVRDIAIKGESGILARCPPDERPAYKPSKRLLEWPNGAESLLFTAEEPERLRGYNHMKLWCDEIGSWRYTESWTQAQFGLRSGNNPQAIVTFTPRNNEIVRKLLAHKQTVWTTGTTYENRANLAEGWYNDIITEYEGSRLGRQELLAELLTDVPGALWNRDMMDACYITRHNPLVRIVVAIDPQAATTEGTSSTGIIVAGIDGNGMGYVLEDLTMSGSPAEWARIAVDAYQRWQADRIVAETNNGGDMVIHTLKTVDNSVATRKLHASRGKYTRAEPIAALYEQGRCKHVGSFAKLEDQMCTWLPGDDSPDRLDAMVWAFTDLMVKKRPRPVQPRGLR